MGRNLKRNLIGKTALLEKSSELALPLEWLFAGYVMQQLTAELAGSARAQRLLLKNPGVLEMSDFGREGSHRLYYVYVKQPDEVFCKADFSVFLKNTIKWDTGSNILWSWRSHMEGSRLLVELVAVLDDMRMPVELVVDAVEEASFSYPACEYQMRLVMENNKTCQVAVYPQEEIFFDDLGEVLTKLELIGDMAVYERIYETLGVLNFEGRQFQKSFETFCSDHGLTADETRYAQMEHYQSYPYMKKKWKSYLKRQKKNGPTWEAVYGRLWSFLMPPWKAALQGMVYLGSWIADLGRYLD